MPHCEFDLHVEHLFVILSAITTFWKSVYSNPLPNLKIGYLALLLTCKGLLYIVNTSSLSVMVSVI